MYQNKKYINYRFVVLIIAFFFVQCSGDYYPIAEIFAPFTDIPMIKYQSIADGDTDVGLLPEIVITFSEPMHFRSIKKNLSFREENISDVTCDVTIDSDLKKITIKPTNFLKNNSVYNILIKKDARTAKLYPLTDDIKINFITTDDDTIKPEVLGTNIDDRLDVVAGNENIIVYFSKPMDLDSLYKNIILRDSVDATIDIALSASGTSAFIKPIEPLAPYGEYTLIIKNDAYDTSLFKNKLKDGKTFNFKVKGEYKLRSVIGASKYLYTPSFVAVSDINGEKYLYTTSIDNKIRMYKKNSGVSLSDNNPYTDPSSDSYILINEWSVVGNEYKKYVYIKGIDTDNEGNIYVADADLNRIIKYDYNGNFIKSFGRSGDGYGEFNAPYDVACSDDGFLFVTDRDNYRVQKFDLEGNFINCWGEKGNGEGEFGIINGLTTDNNGNVYVVNIGINDLALDHSIINVLKFDSNGVYIGKFGGDGRLIQPIDVAIDDDFNIYVSDKYNCYISVYNKSGQLLYEISNFGRPNGLSIDNDNNLCITETDFGTTLLFDSIEKKTKVILSSLFFYTDFQTNLSNLKYPLNLTIDNSGDLYIANSAGNNIKKFDKNGEYLDTYGGYGSNPAEYFYPTGIYTLGNGQIYVTDPGNRRVQIFDRNFNYITSFGEFGTEVGQFGYPYHILCDEFGNIYINDVNTYKILKYDPNGGFIREWYTNNKIYDFAIHDGCIFILSNGYMFSEVNIYDLEGNFISKFGEYGFGIDQFDNPQELTIDKEGLIYIADTYNHRVVIYRYENNNFIYKDHFSTGEYTPTSIEVNDSKTVYILDSTKNGIIIYDLLSY